MLKRGTCLSSSLEQLCLRSRELETERLAKASDPESSEYVQLITRRDSGSVASNLKAAVCVTSCAIPEASLIKVDSCFA